VAIEDQVAATIPETLKILSDQTDWSDDTVDAKIDAVLSETFPDVPQPVDEGDLGLTDFQERYLGDAATLLICDAAIDYFMVRTGRLDSIQGVPAGQSARSQRTSGPGTGRQNYDRVQALKDLGTRLLARLTADAQKFLTSFPSAATGTFAAGMMISTFDAPFKTLDPARIMRINPLPWGTTGWGTVWGPFSDDILDPDATNL